ncbi:hypothetical protein DdX_18006 [Ditylenchus destructor]|uniref:Uncharacterized protein n=1 Tax=Ditylenchus destructor TaxID=166010 RepID=A0AAD4MLG5_9BILA|nr:hypothetical protein DdX_18006 [Ditylenchus destructor]
MASNGPGTSAASTTENLVPPNVNDDKLIKSSFLSVVIYSIDTVNTVFQVPKLLLGTCSGWIFLVQFHFEFRDVGCEVDENFVFPMPAVKPETFQKVVEWTANHIGVPDPEVKEDPSTRERIWFTLNDFENKFFALHPKNAPPKIPCDVLTALT